MSDKEATPERADVDENAKDQQLETFRRDSDGQYLTTNQGVRVSNDDDSLNAKALKTQGEALHFVKEAFKHGKAVGATSDGIELLRMARLNGIQLADSARVVDSAGVVTAAGPASTADKLKGAVGLSESTGPGGFAEHFLRALAEHRHWDRDMSEMVPA